MKSRNGRLSKLEPYSEISAIRRLVELGLKAKK